MNTTVLQGRVRRWHRGEVRLRIHQGRVQTHGRLTSAEVAAVRDEPTVSRAVVGVWLSDTTQGELELMRARDAGGGS